MVIIAVVLFLVVLLAVPEILQCYDPATVTSVTTYRSIGTSACASNAVVQCPGPCSVYLPSGHAILSNAPYSRHATSRLVTKHASQIPRDRSPIEVALDGTVAVKCYTSTVFTV
ncbi:hypothetical protein BC629DRAFT_59594 [Irpex lacteus]|nr:hypothetical protein BC629DRAFT_59594 [Irpex lacteus]